MLNTIEILDEERICTKRLVFTSKTERDFNYDVLKRDYGKNFCIIKRTYKEVTND